MHFCNMVLKFCDIYFIACCFCFSEPIKYTDLNAAKENAGEPFYSELAEN